MQAKDIKVGREYAVHHFEGPLRVRVTELRKPVKSFYGGHGRTKIIGVKLDPKTGVVREVDGVAVTVEVYSDAVGGEWAVVAREIEEREAQLEKDRRARENHERRLLAVATALGVTHEDLARSNVTSYRDRTIMLSAATDERRSTITFHLPFAEEIVKRLGLVKEPEPEWLQTP